MENLLDLKKNYHNKTVLVTGGAGFIGSNLVDALLDLNAKVTVLDNFSTGNMQNLQHNLNKIRLIIGDITKDADCALACQNQEIIFHTAAMTAVTQCEQNIDSCRNINVQGTEHLLRHCEENAVFVFSSSAAVYGNCTTPCVETQDLVPLSLYGQTKVQGEQLCAQYAQQHNIKTVALRYFNVHGNRQELNPNPSVVTIFRQKVAARQTVTIFGDGQQQRDFVSVNKVVHANLCAAITANKPFNCYNVASGKSITLLQLLTGIAQNLQLPVPPINLRPALATDIANSSACCQKLQSMLNQCVLPGSLPHA